MYLLDANIFITAKNAHYGFDFAPGFWEWIERQHHLGTVYTVDAVGGEIKGGKDDLATWAKSLPAKFFKSPSGPTTVSMAKLATWAHGGIYTPGAISKFLGSADYYLVATADALGWTVVTHERSEPGRRNLIKIPDACNALGVAHTLPWPMLRKERARFVL